MDVTGQSIQHHLSPWSCCTSQSNLMVAFWNAVSGSLHDVSLYKGLMQHPPGAGCQNTDMMIRQSRDQSLLYCLGCRDWSAASMSFAARTEGLGSSSDS